MLDNKQISKLIKNITLAFTSGDNSKLTIHSSQWLINNYWLRPETYWDLVYPNRHYTKKSFDKFFTSFSLLEWITSDIDLNHALGWINHWVVKNNGAGGKQENIEDCIRIFKQRCYVVNTLRKTLGLKAYTIHFLRFDRHYYKKNQFKKSTTQLRGFEINQVTKDFLHRYRHFHAADGFVKIKKIRELSFCPLYCIARNQVTKEVFDFLTTDNDSLKIW